MKTNLLATLMCLVLVADRPVFAVVHRQAVLLLPELLWAAGNSGGCYSGDHTNSLAGSSNRCASGTGKDSWNRCASRIGKDNSNRRNSRGFSDPDPGWSQPEGQRLFRLGLPQDFYARCYGQ
jgi:hypothetical protein